jgi:hypothetical protein
MADPAVWLQMSTIGEEGTERCAQLAAERGIRSGLARPERAAEPVESAQTTRSSDKARRRANPEILEKIGLISGRRHEFL